MQTFTEYYDEVGAYIQSKFPEGITQETADGISSSLMEEFEGANLFVPIRAKVVGNRTEVQAAIPTNFQMALLTYVRTKKMEVTGV
jgi:hypothetical protein